MDHLSIPSIFLPFYTLTFLCSWYLHGVWHSLASFQLLDDSGQRQTTLNLFQLIHIYLSFRPAYDQLQTLHYYIQNLSRLLGKALLRVMPLLQSHLLQEGNQKYPFLRLMFLMLSFPLYTFPGHTLNFQLLLSKILWLGRSGTTSCWTYLLSADLI